MAGVGVPGVSAVAVGRMSSVCTVAMPTVSTMSGVPALSMMPDVGKAADCHCGEASTAEREAEAIDVHTSNTTCLADAW
jgi:hypothetical protein